MLKAGLEPLFIDLRGAGWISENEYKVQNNARRFEYWECANALMMGSKEALKYSLSLSIENIENRNKQLVAKLKKELENINTIPLLDHGKRQCSIITFSI